MILDIPTWISVREYPRWTAKLPCDTGVISVLLAAGRRCHCLDAVHNQVQHELKANSNPGRCPIAQPSEESFPQKIRYRELGCVAHIEARPDKARVGIMERVGAERADMILRLTAQYEAGAASSTSEFLRL
jgi:hypothetical protein